MKKHYIILSVLLLNTLMLLSCKKDKKGPFTVTVSNPFNYEVLVKGHVDGCSFSKYKESSYCRIGANGHQTYSSQENSSTKVHSVQLFVERVSDGKQVGALNFEGKSGKIYDWTIGYGNEPVLFESTDDDGNNSLTGKWTNLASCKNANGTSSYFQFNSDGTGKFFNADCNSTCSGYGLTFYFDFNVSGSSLSLKYTKTDNYCGKPVNKPAPEKLTFSKSGKKLTINGVNYTKVN